MVDDVASGLGSGAGITNHNALKTIYLQHKTQCTVETYLHTHAAASRGAVLSNAWLRL